MNDWRADLLRLWFGLSQKQQFGRDAALDHRIKQQFLKTWDEQRQLPAGSFLSHPLSALAAVILFDQLPRNMFRGHADQFSTDHLALAIVKAAIEKGFDEQLPGRERNFLYMPFEHSENLDEQDRGLILQMATGDASFIAAAQKHRDIIARFGRFPHRNEILGRAARPDEVAAGNVTPF